MSYKVYLFCLLALFIFTGCSHGESESLDASLSQYAYSIYGGAKDTNPAHEAVVSLFYTPHNTSFCTGTLIAPNWVLTASHCVIENGQIMPEALKYKIGVGDTEKQLSYNLHDIDGIYPHENYDEYSSGNDIALIHLKRSIKDIEPIQILSPDIGFTNESIATGDVKVEFVGFGYDENRDYGTKLTFIGTVSDYCGSETDSMSGCRTPNGYMPFGSIYYTQRQGGPCNGDSGGPAFITVDGIEYVAGITSYGDSWCTVYGVSTAVQNFYNWIIEETTRVGDPLIEIISKPINNNEEETSDDSNENPVIDNGEDNSNEESDEDDWYYWWDDDWYFPAWQW